MNLPIGKAILFFREMREMSQTDLEKYSGIQQSVISLYERQKRLPSMDNLLKISTALGISVDDIERKAIEIHGEKDLIVTSKIKDHQDVKLQASPRKIRTASGEQFDFFITEDISVSVRCVVRDHSKRRIYRNNVITSITESVINKFLEDHYDEIQERMFEELHENKYEIDKLMEKVHRNRY